LIRPAGETARVAPSAGALEAFHLDVSTECELGRRFCLHHLPPPGCELAGLILHVHAFAEEMNKSRRMAAMQARAFAAAGWATLQIDLLGCGDSDGDLVDVTWSRWVADVVAAGRWLQDRHSRAGAAPSLWLWGHRAGALLAAEAASQFDAVTNFLFWHPVLSGRALLHQFLRLKTMTDLKGRPKPGALKALHQQLAAGIAVDVAGYTLPPALAEGLQRAQLQPPARGADVVWLEVGSRGNPVLSPASLPVLEEWESAGHRVKAQAVSGPAFWQTVEVEDAPALITATLSALHGVPRPRLVHVPAK
jgi:exosortase A-associated hydrolase 2